jgi:hypothetical protein
MALRNSATMQAHPCLRARTTRYASICYLSSTVSGHAPGIEGTGDKYRIVERAKECLVESVDESDVLTFEANTNDLAPISIGYSAPCFGMAGSRSGSLISSFETNACNSI